MVIQQPADPWDTYGNGAAAMVSYVDAARPQRRISTLAGGDDHSLVPANLAQRQGYRHVFNVLNSMAG